MLKNLITAALAFISTNIDDIFILMLFFGSKKYKRWTIISGQYLGIASLVVISLILSYIGNFLDQRYIGLLGLFPIFLAIKQTVALTKESDARDDEQDLTVTATGVFAIAGVTIANGGDNVGVYVPLFSIMSTFEEVQTIIIAKRNCIIKTSAGGNDFLYQVAEFSQQDAQADRRFA